MLSEELKVMKVKFLQANNGLKINKLEAIFEMMCLMPGHLHQGILMY